MKCYFTIIFFGFIHLLAAQHTLNGIVLDSFFNNPISNVNIYVPSLNMSTTTDKNGSFTLRNLPNKKVKIAISISGFKSKIITVNKSVHALKIILESVAETLDNVIVSLPFNNLQSQNVMKVEHQDMKKLKEFGSNTLLNSISKIAGVDQISTGLSIGKPVIRGLSGNRILIYSQGLRLENINFGDEQGIGINEAGIESVEIIKGPASLLYGSDAIGGVLYFNNEKFANTNKTNTEISEKYFNNTNGFNTSVMIKSSGRKLKFIGRATYDTHEDYKIPAGDKVTNSRYQEKDYKIGIGFNNDLFSSTLRYNYNNRNLGIIEHGIAEQTNNRTPDFPRILVENQIISLHNQVFFKKSKIDANLGYLYNNFSDFEETDLASSQLLVNTYNYDLKYYFPEYKGLETIIGIQGMQQKNKNKVVGEILIPNATIQDYGVLSTANYHWKNNSIQTGLRFDTRKINIKTIKINKVFNSFNASLGYKSKLFKNITSRVNIATGYRAPTIAELAADGFHSGINQYEKGNRNLKSEKNLQIDLDIKFNNKQISVFLNGFHNTINQYIYLKPTGNFINQIPLYNYVQEDATLKGGECGFDFHPTKTPWLHILSSYETVIAQEKDGAYLPLIPANKINSTFKAMFDTNTFKNIYFAINYENVFKQNNVSFLETASKAYNLLNLSFGNSLKTENFNLHFNFSINNVLDTKYISHLSKLKINNIPNQGRNISVGVDIKIH